MSSMDNLVAFKFHISKVQWNGGWTGTEKSEEKESDLVHSCKSCPGSLNMKPDAEGNYKHEK